MFVVIVMDESGEQFVAYFLPTDETMAKRAEDMTEGVEYKEDMEYEYKMAREYNWNVKSKASKGYEENFFFLFRGDGVYYNELETRVRLSCAVDMQCMVSYVKWYRAMSNGEIRTWGGLRSFRL